jgi:hypothetical protein
MRISDHRYSRDRQRFDIALRFIQHEARTHTIRLWTGLTDDRIRKLYRSYSSDPLRAGPARHRGKSPQRAGFFLRTVRVRQEAALLASLCRLLGVLPPGRIIDAHRSLPNISRGELLCRAYEMYRSLVPEPSISFEHAVFLLTTLACAEELTLGNCRDCGALLVVDRLSLRQPQCSQCASVVSSLPAGAPPEARVQPGTAC